MHTNIPYSIAQQSTLTGRMKKQVFFSIEQTNSVKLLQPQADTTDLFYNARKTIPGNLKFPCQNIHCDSQCLCKGLGYITGNNNFIRFVQSIVEFKLGNNPQSRDFFSNIIDQSSIRQNSIRQSSILQDFKQVSLLSRSVRRSMLPQRQSMQIQPKNIIHNGIQCDQCHQNPIRGKRYFCRTCNDYDLCQSCYKLETHHHKNFQVIAQSRSQICKERLRNYALKQSSIASSRLANVLFKIGQIS